jgi:hypothetical protein
VAAASLLAAAAACARVPGTHRCVSRARCRARCCRRSNATRLEELAEIYAADPNEAYDQVQQALACVSDAEGDVGCTNSLGIPTMMNVSFGGLTCTTGQGSDRRHLCSDGCDRKVPHRPAARRAAPLRTPTARGCVTSSFSQA